MWVQHENFRGLVEEYWSVPIRGTKQFILCRKLKLLKRGLRQLNSTHFAHISSKAEEARRKLKQAQLMLHSNLEDDIGKQEVRFSQGKAAFLIDAKRKFLAQKSKCEFLLQGDKNTRLFHSLIKRNAKRNFIASLMKEDGTFTTSNNEMQKELLCFYENLMGSWHGTTGSREEVMGNGPILSLVQAASLEVEVTKDEIKTALMDIGDDKSPRPDGYTSCFFKKPGLWWGMICVMQF